jgi:hypothetical protein
LVHSDEAGRCTICATPLAAEQAAATQPSSKEIPADAKYACPMKECWVFSPTEGQCPKCEMELKPLGEIEWAGKTTAEAAPDESAYVCPMHPERAKSSKPGPCTICAMQMIPRARLKRPETAPARIAAQIDYITEHYLELQKLLASDQTKDVALHALGLASASEALVKCLAESPTGAPDEVANAAKDLRAAALKITGKNIEADRVTFVKLSAAMRKLIRHFRPDKKRWPTLYIYHCPMTKGDWIQATEGMKNPYYGFKMLKCGKLQGVE